MLLLVSWLLQTQRFICWPKSCFVILKASNLAKLFGVLLASNFPSCLAKSMLIQMQARPTSCRNAKVHSATWSSATMQCSAGNLLCLLWHSVLAMSSAEARESVLFIGTQFSNLYTAVDTPTKGRVVVRVWVDCPFALVLLMSLTAVNL